MKGSLRKGYYHFCDYFFLLELLKTPHFWWFDFFHFPKPKNLKKSHFQFFFNFFPNFIIFAQFFVLLIKIPFLCFRFDFVFIHSIPELDELISLDEIIKYMPKRRIAMIDTLDHTAQWTIPYAQKVGYYFHRQLDERMCDWWYYFILIWYILRCFCNKLRWLPVCRTKK